MRTACAITLWENSVTSLIRNPRRTATALILSLLTSSWVAAQPAEQPEPPKGTVYVVVFRAPRSVPVAGALVNLGQISAATNENGAATLSAAPGTHPLRIDLPADALLDRTEATAAWVATPDVRVAAGETTQVIVSLTAQGALASTDIEVPVDTAGESQAERETARAEHTRAKGIVRGRVVSLEDKTPIAGARVFVRGAPVDAETDLQGRYEFDLPEGTYTLSAVHGDFSTQTIDDVVVPPNGEAQVAIELTPASPELEEYVVRAPHIEGTIASLMDERRASAAVTDAIGAEDISRMPASDAAQAAQRIVGATVVGGRFVYVRGLGERYVSAQLNGAPLPSPEPDRATVPLDLFPAQIIDSLDISKTFTPDVPADFAGGSVRIETRTIPEKPIFAASLSLGANTQSTFQKVLGQRASSTDWLGFDDGMRAMPDVPDDFRLRVGTRKEDGERVTREEVDEAGRALNSPMYPVERILLPNGSGSILAGSSWKLGREARVGAAASLVYRRSFSARSETIRDFQASTATDTGLQVLNRYAVDVSNDELRWGAFAVTGLDISEDHRLTLLGMHSQLADTTTRVFDGYSQNTMSDIGSSGLDFASRSLDFGQLQGRHGFPMLNDALLEWGLTLALAQRHEPDLRTVVYERPQGQDNFQYLTGANRGRHFFSNQSEISRGAGLDWTQPLTTDEAFALQLKAGAFVTIKDREFRPRLFNFVPDEPGDDLICGPNYDPIRCPRELFVDANIGTLLRLEENTATGDAYDAELEVHAGYLMTDVGIGERLRIIGGVRVEKTDQALIPWDQFSNRELEKDRADLNRLDPLPALSVVYSFTPELAVRAAASRTLARPQLRELAPFAFQDYFNGIPVAGNPDLDMTTILNGDLRLEYFPTPREVLAISFFAKDFTDPIEPLIKPSGSSDVQTFENAQGAQLFGVELEARKGLGFVSPALEDFSAIGSLMLARSTIDVRQTGDEFLTNTSRPLVNQAPYVINFALDYETQNGTQARILYNVSGPTLVQVGTAGLEDAYLHPKHLLDVTAAQAIGEHFKLKLTIENLLNAEHVVTQGEDDLGYNVRYSYRDGISASIGLSYTH